MAGNRRRGKIAVVLESSSVRRAKPNALDSTWSICEKSNSDGSGPQHFIDPRAAGGSGVHWGALQSVAWTRMLAENLRTTSFTEAVVRTFNAPASMLPL